MDHNTVIIMEREAQFKQQLESTLREIVESNTRILARLEELAANDQKVNKGGKAKAEQ